MKGYFSLIFGIAAIIIGTTPVIFTPYLGVLLGGLGIHFYVKRDEDNGFAKAGVIVSIIGISLSANLIWNYFVNEVLYEFVESSFLEGLWIFS